MFGTTEGVQRRMKSLKSASTAHNFCRSSKVERRIVNFLLELGQNVLRINLNIFQRE